MSTKTKTLQYTEQPPLLSDRENTIMAVLALSMGLNLFFFVAWLLARVG